MRVMDIQKKRKSALSILLSATILYVQPLIAQEAEFDAADMTELVNTYCTLCHNDTAMTGNLTLQDIDFFSPGEFSEKLEKVVVKLNAHMMPPAGMPRPEFEVYEKMITWLETELDNAWMVKRFSGRLSPIHRMNRYEYNNTINDLLGLDVDVMSLLPGDPTADGGFDNMAESLPFSTVHIERYMSVAREVTRLATGTLPTGPSVMVYEVPLQLKQNWRQSEDLPFGSRGGISVSHIFPVDGDYKLEIELEANYQDYIKGLGWSQEIEIRIDGELLKRFTVGGDEPDDPSPMSFSGTGEPGGIEWETYMLSAGDGMEVTVPVKAGPRTIGVSFVREFMEPEGIPQPVQQGRLFANDEDTMGYQKLHKLEVSGPFNMGAVTNTDTPSRRKIFSCYPANNDTTEEKRCANEILARMAREAYRRPIADIDIEYLSSFYNRGKERGGSFKAGIQLALEFLLSDPDFLVRTYIPRESRTKEASYALNDIELASRLSYFLWSSAPDDELLKLAELGSLSDPDVLKNQVLRMLFDSRGIATFVEDFASQWLNLRRLKEVQVDTVIYPEFDLSLIDAFEKETQLFIANSLRNDTSVMDLLGADYTFLNERLADHYGIEGVYGSRFRKVQLDNMEQRGGLLAHGSLLTVTSYPGRTSPVLRGKWLLDNMLGTPPPPPPPNVSILPDSEMGQAPKTIRERLTQHRQNPVCASCHVVIDPLGFALENFDVIGGWRLFDEGGNPVDPDGTYPGGVNFEGFSDLRDWMLNRPERFTHTLTEKLMAYALGRRIEYFDQPSIRKIVSDAENSNYNWSSLVIGIVNSDAFLNNASLNVDSISTAKN